MCLRHRRTFVRKVRGRGLSPAVMMMRSSKQASEPAIVESPRSPTGMFSLAGRNASFEFFFPRALCYGGTVRYVT